jgi:hypothetical protein
MAKPVLVVVDDDDASLQALTAELDSRYGVHYQVVSGPHWPLQRAPFPLETTIPGVFAAGDVRHGSIKRVASAVGDGSIAIRLIHDYLALPPQNAKGDEPRLRGQGGSLAAARGARPAHRRR